MSHRTKVVDIELSNRPTTIEGLDGYESLKALVHLHGTPIAYIQMPVIGNRCTATAIREAILDQHLCFSIDVCCCFIKYKYSGFRSECTSERQKLSFAGRKSNPSFRNTFIVLLWKPINKFISVYECGDLFHFFIAQ